MKVNISISLVFSMCLAFCINTHSFAQTLAKSIKSSNVKWNVLKLDKKFNKNRWVVLEGDSKCAFFVKYSSVQNKLRQEIALKLTECDGMTDTTYELLADNILLANWQEERGGAVFLFLPTSQKIFWIELSYMSGDEDSLVAKIQGAQILISTSIHKFVLDIIPNEGLKIVKNMAQIENEQVCTSTKRFKECGSKENSKQVWSGEQNEQLE